MRLSIAALYFSCALLLLGASLDPRDNEISLLVEPVRAPYVATPDPVVKRMLDIAEIGPGDVLYDLGSGDGRIVIAAALRGARAIGIEIDPDLVALSRENAKAAGVSERVKFETADLFGVDLTAATVVTLYLLPELNLQLRPKLFAELAPGTRVISHAFDMWDWRPEHTEVVEHEGRGHTVYAWIVPTSFNGTWRFRASWDGRRERTHVLTLNQTYQRVRGSLDADRRPRPISEGRVRGRSLSFEVDGPDGAPLNFSGSIDAGQLVGTLGEVKIVATREM